MNAMMMNLKIKKGNQWAFDKSKKHFMVYAGTAFLDQILS